MVATQQIQDLSLNNFCSAYHLNFKFSGMFLDMPNCLLTSKQKFGQKVILKSDFDIAVDVRFHWARYGNPE